MTASTQEQQSALAGRVRETIRDLDGTMQRLRKANAGLLVAGMATSAASTLVTGVTAAGGPVVGSGIPGWRMACIVGAILSFGATILLGLNERLRIAARLTEGQTCAGRLRALDIAMTTGSKPWEELVEEYRAIVQTYPHLID